MSKLRSTGNQEADPISDSRARVAVFCQGLSTADAVWLRTTGTVSGRGSFQDTRAPPTSCCRRPTVSKGERHRRTLPFRDPSRTREADARPGRAGARAQPYGPCMPPRFLLRASRPPGFPRFDPGRHGPLHPVQIGPKPRMHTPSEERAQPPTTTCRVDLVPRSANCGRLMPPGAAFCPVFGGAFTVRFVIFSASSQTSNNTSAGGAAHRGVTKSIRPSRTWLAGTRRTGSVRSDRMKLKRARITRVSSPGST